MRFLKIRKHAIPAWLILVIMLSIFGAAAAAYDLSTLFNVPLQVKAPITVVNYPSQFSLYPGEAENFTVTVSNQAPVNYSAILSFELNDSAYQASYVTFSNTVYEVVSGQQNLAAWLSVNSDAPPANLMVSIDVVRIGDSTVAPPSSGNLVNGNFETGTFSGWNVVGSDSITTTPVHTGSYSAYISSLQYDSSIDQVLNLPANQNYRLQGYVYPSRVGSLGQAESPYCGIVLDYYDRSTMTLRIQECYSWCWNEIAGNGTIPSGVDVVNFRLNFNVASWNLFSVTATQDVRAYFTSLDYSQLVLHDITFVYHYSMTNPGAFYLDDLALSSSS